MLLKTKHSLINIDPITKVLAFLAANVIMLGIKSYLSEMILFSLVLVMGINGRKYGASAKYLIVYMALLLFDICMKDGGSTAVIMTIIVDRIVRMFVPIIFSIFILIHTTMTGEFIASFQRSRLPMGFIIPFAVLVRFAPTVREEFASIKRAMSYRGVGTGIGAVLLHPLKTMENIIAPLMISSVNVMDELAAASMTRGLDVQVKRTSIYKVKFRIQDAVLAVLFVTLTVMTKWGHI